MGLDLTYRAHALLPQLRSTVRCVWELRCPHDAVIPQLILPDGGTELILSFGDPLERLVDAGSAIQAPRTFLVAEPRRSVTSQAKGRVELLGVRFWPGGSRSFVDATGREMVDRVFDDSVLAASLAREIERSVHSAPAEERVTRLQLALVAHAMRARPADQVVREAIWALMKRDGRVAIEELARAAGLSRRQLERRFADEVGLSPKSLANIVRFRRVLQVIEERPSDWATVAIRCGYSDQSHLIRDFKRFTGQTPGSWAQGDPLTAMLEGART